MTNKHLNLFSESNQFLKLTANVNFSQVQTKENSNDTKLQEGVSKDTQIGEALSGKTRQNTQNQKYNDNLLSNEGFYDDDMLDLTSLKTGNSSSTNYYDSSYITKITTPPDNISALSASTVYKDGFESEYNSFSAVPNDLMYETIVNSMGSNKYNYDENSSSSLASIISEYKEFGDYSSMPEQPKKSNLKKYKKDIYRDKTTNRYWKKDSKGMYVDVTNEISAMRSHK